MSLAIPPPPTETADTTARELVALRAAPALRERCPQCQTMTFRSKGAYRDRAWVCGCLFVATLPGVETFS